MRFLLAASLATLTPGFCDTSYVPDDHATIQAAIDAAAFGDTIVVRAGTYAENLDFQGKPLTVVGEEGPSATTVDGQGLGPVVTFDSGEGAGSILEGLTLTGGVGGVYCQDSSPTIRGNWITGNTDTNNGGGIYLEGDCNGRIEGNEIWSNVGAGGGGILMRLSNSTPTIEGNTIRDNVADGDHGGGIYSVNGSPAIVNNHITGNTTQDSGGGLILIFSAPTPPVISRNRITENFAGDDGGGIWCATIADVEISDNVIAGNTSPHGAGLYLRDVTVPVRRNTIVHNTATVAGGGFYFDGGNSADVNSCIVFYNSAPAEPQFAMNGDPVRVSYSHVEGGWPGPYNSVFNPWFVDEDGEDDDPATIDDNVYRLRRLSTCVDSGDPLDLPCPALDAGGYPRLISRSLFGTWRIDRGAHEFTNVRIRLASVPAGSGHFSRVPLGWSLVKVKAMGPTYGLPCTIYVGDPLVGCVDLMGATYVDLTTANAIDAGVLPSSTIIAVPPGKVIQAVISSGVGNTSNPITVD